MTIGALVGLLFTLIILGVLWWAAKRLIALVPMGEPFKTIVDIVIVVIGVLVVLWVLAQLLGFAGVHVPRLG